MLRLLLLSFCRFLCGCLFGCCFFLCRHSQYHLLISRAAGALVADCNAPVNLRQEELAQNRKYFSPAAVARKVDSLNKLLQARTELANLLTYMDGKDKAEELVGRLLNNPDLMKSLAAAPNPESQPANP